MPKEISQEYLKSILHYCPDTGIFTYIKKVSHKINIGQKAGTIQKSHSGKPYAHISINGCRYRYHHLVWLYVYGYMPTMTIDHLDGDGTNNKVSNLEEKTLQENNKNKRLFEKNKLGITGVYWRKDRGLFAAQIKLNRINRHLIYTSDFFEACCARKSAERRLGFHENHGSIRPL